jgi:hypothetical protein
MAKALARDPRIPRWLRWMFVFGCLPIPLFFDEVVLVIASGILYVVHRDIVVETWRRTTVV